MTNWELNKSDTWQICADGKCVATCDNETDARKLLSTIKNIEESDCRLGAF